MSPYNIHILREPSSVALRCVHIAVVVEWRAWKKDWKINIMIGLQCSVLACVSVWVVHQSEWTAFFFAYFTNNIKGEEILSVKWVSYLAYGLWFVYLFRFRSIEPDDQRTVFEFFIFHFARSLLDLNAFIVRFVWLRCACSMPSIARLFLLLFPFCGPLYTLWLLYMNLIIVPIVGIFCAL